MVTQGCRSDLDCTKALLEAKRSFPKICKKTEVTSGASHFRFQFKFDQTVVLAEPDLVDKFILTEKSQSCGYIVGIQYRAREQGTQRHTEP